MLVNGHALLQPYTSSVVLRWCVTNSASFVTVPVLSMNLTCINNKVYVEIYVATGTFICIFTWTHSRRKLPYPIQTENWA